MELWESFPAAASPRPLVLIGARVSMSGGFVDGKAKMAAFNGAIEPEVSLPPGVLDLIKGNGRGPAVAPIRLTAIERTNASFLCDRGPTDLAAYRVSITGLRGHMTVLDPTVDCWWPPPSRSRGVHLAEARIDGDDRTLHFPAFGGLLTEFLHAEFDEHENYVIGRPVTREPRHDGMVPAVGVERAVTGSLKAPLGGRALVNEDGEPLAVTRVE